MSKYLKYFAQNVLLRMKSTGTRKTDLKEKTGLSASNIDGYLKQKTYPGLKAIVLIAEALDTTPSQLLTNPHDVGNLLESYVRVRDDLRALTEAEGIGWPPPVDYLAKILK